MLRLPGDGSMRALALRVAGVLLVAVLLYYPVGMALIHNVDNDLDFMAPEAATSPETSPTEKKRGAKMAGESQAVAVAAGLIERETDINRWTMNDPFFLPGAALDNMPNFQQGVIYAMSRFAIEMTDQIGRIRGSSQVDKDLDSAAGRLKFPGDIWYFDIATSWAPATPSEQHYRAARKALVAYNRRLAAGEAVFERRADNLQITLERITADLGSASAIIEEHVSNGAWFMDFDADDIFYRTQGRLYGYALILRGLRADFQPVIEERELGAAWDQMLESFRAASALDPLIVVNGAPDGALLPSHLAAQGFYLLRARTQLKEIANILLK
ncbi:MAG: DUF2333 family protein [Rhodospirillales bacterium]|nr:DUF2333 family protein [Rhodospirillales bacterium]MBT5107263.1 DUF2333 family protein [Rhodospirillaceae bacterium]MBT5666647.1 DUF2333 family protein [Rhodospirillaceae bacterium]